MQPTQTIWQNGKLIPWDDAKVHVLSHGLHYGGGAFEGIRFYKTANGPAIFRLSEHVDRLIYSAETLKMNLPYSKSEIIPAIQSVVQASALEAGYIRPIAFYGYGKMGVNPMGCPIEFVIACWPWGAYLVDEQADVKVSRYIRIHPDSSVVDAKLCGNYINSILASLELHNTHYHEALFLDNRGYICEGVGENFFMIKNDVIFTPKLGSILTGITRDTVIELARELEYEVIETDISLEEAYQADEAFFTGTAAEVTSIRSIDDKVLTEGKVGTLTSILKEAYLNLVHGRNPNFMDYVTYV
jgi:branched-chain amino acid aminotransferase